MPIIRFAVGFAAGLADSFASIKTRDRIMASVEYTGHTLDGFDMAADLCSTGRDIIRKIAVRFVRTPTLHIDPESICDGRLAALLDRLDFMSCLSDDDAAEVIPDVMDAYAALFRDRREATLRAIARCA